MTKMYKRCSTCKGLGKVEGLGYMFKTCHTCAGAKRVEIEDLEPPKSSQSDPVIQAALKESVKPIIKKRGRKPGKKSGAASKSVTVMDFGKYHPDLA